MYIDTTALPVSFTVHRTPAQLVYSGATAISIEVYNGTDWQTYNDPDGTAYALTGNGNLAINLPGQYRLTGTSLTSGAIYSAYE